MKSPDLIFNTYKYLWFFYFFEKEAFILLKRKFQYYERFEIKFNCLEIIEKKIDYHWRNGVNINRQLMVIYLYRVAL